MLKPRDLPANIREIELTIETENKIECRLYLQCARCRKPADPPVMVGNHYYCKPCASELAVKAMIV